MGTKLHVYSGGKVMTLTVDLPMKSLAKCRLDARQGVSLAQIPKNMPVYLSISTPGKKIDERSHFPAVACQGPSLMSEEFYDDIGDFLFILSLPRCLGNGQTDNVWEKQTVNAHPTRNSCRKSLPPKARSPRPASKHRQRSFRCHGTPSHTRPWRRRWKRQM
jgi:hypothetical protein